ncbi:MAG TPA: hypothetical protein VFY65_19175, partial [Longimicrobium sp.]|nr:hypothetical protein [Longimicrobium sp.]
MSHRDANRFFAPRRMLLAMLLLAGCGGGDGPTDPGPPAGGDPDPNPPPATAGQVVFWTDNAGLAPIAVNVNGGSGSI